MSGLHSLPNFIFSLTPLSSFTLPCFKLASTTVVNMFNFRSPTPTNTDQSVYKGVHAAASEAQRTFRLGVPQWPFKMPGNFSYTSTAPTLLVARNTDSRLATLPTELLISILQHLPGKDIAKVQRVCTRFRWL